MERETEGFPLTSIREINILLALHHKNIVNVTEVGPLQMPQHYCCHNCMLMGPSYGYTAVSRLVTVVAAKQLHHATKAFTHHVAA